MGSKGTRHGKVTVGGKAAARNEGGRPSRAAEMAAATLDTQRRHGRKDTRRWCKGKPGREHAAEIVLRPWYGRECGKPSWYPQWVCQHAEVCAACGKVLRHLRVDECPDYRERGHAEAAHDRGEQDGHGRAPVLCCPV
jgi:hypothetical protein